MKIVVSVPGKIILSGEHAVVYGKPAIAAAVDKRLTVTLQSRNDGKKTINTDVDDDKLVKEAIKIVHSATEKKYTDRHALFRNGYQLDIESEIPAGAGMGSSAALGAGIVAAFAAAVSKSSKLNVKEINDLTYKVEKIQHGNPSGLDPTTVCFGGLVWYRKELEFLKTFWKLQFKVADKLNSFYGIDTGKPEETTGEMVGLVSEKLKAKSVKVKRESQNILNEIEKQTKQLTLGLRGENEEMVMGAIKRNEELLNKLGIVGEFAKEVIAKIDNSGGAAKISGAGGIKDRSGIIMVYHNDRQKVAKIAKEHKLNWFSARLGAEGVKIERMTV